MLTILGGICLVPFIILFPETCRNVVGNGSYNGGALNKPLVPVLNPPESIAPPKDGKFNHRLRRVPNPFACLRVIAKRHDALLFASYSLFYLRIVQMLLPSCPCTPSHAALSPQRSPGGPLLLIIRNCYYRILVCGRSVKNPRHSPNALKR